MQSGSGAIHGAVMVCRSVGKFGMILRDGFVKVIGTSFAIRT